MNQLPEFKQYIEHEKQDETLFYEKFLTGHMYNDLEQVLHHISQEYMSMGYKNAAVKQHTVRLGIVGGDRAITEFLCAYIRLKQLDYRRPKDANYVAYFLKDINYQIYLYPTAKSLLASFIARYDSWYNRHILIPCASDNFIIPWLESGSDVNTKITSTQKIDKLTLPGQLLRNLSNHYIKDSLSQFHFQIFEIRGWKEIANKDEKLADFRMPFISAINIGLQAAVKDFKVRRALDENISVYDIQKHKNFNFKPLSLNISLTRVYANKDLYTLKKEHYENITFDQINISNYAQKDYNTFPKHPSDGYLELYASVIDKSADNMFTTNAQQHINYIKISCNDHNSSFDVLVDNLLLPPLHTIEIRPLKWADQGLTTQQEVFSITTFFPLNFK